MLTKGKSTYSPRSGEKSAGVDAESIAIQALGCIVSDSERLERFLSLTGLQADTIRQEAAKPEFLLAVLDYVAADEPLLLAVATATGMKPDALAAVLARLGGGWQDEP